MKLYLIQKFLSEKTHRSSLFVLLLVLFSILPSCDNDGVSQMYCTKYRVYCYYDVMSYRQLFNAMGNPGQFASMRKQLVDGIYCTIMESSIGKNNYQMDAVQTRFLYGLGGLIVGTSSFNEYLAYDLSCPNCDKAVYRLKISDNGVATCTKCKMTYDLNNYGVILSKGDVSEYITPRGLYRYRISYNGTSLNVYN